MQPNAARPPWNHVRQLKPRLRASVRVRRHQVRGERWYVLADGASRREHRLNDIAYQLIGRCDGRHSVQDVWAALCAERGDAAPTEDEVIRLFVDLEARGLLESVPGGAVPARPAATRRRAAGMVNPFAFRVPLGDPSAWLERLAPLANFLFRPLLGWCWVVAVAVAAVCAAAAWDSLVAYAEVHMSTSRFIALAWLGYPVMKLFHELGHALAVRRWHGEVREYGIGLLMLVPAPYVDASAASSFPLRRQRVVVGAAGIMVEAGLAAAAFALWSNVQAGLVQDLAFVVMVMGALSTLLFNGNPLLRFDGYYVLCDLLELPNLAARSNAWWAAQMRRWLLGVDGERLPAAAGERRWLLGYAPAAFTYRLAIALAAILWLGSYATLLGIAAALYFGATLLLLPVLGWARSALAGASVGSARRQAAARLALLGAAGIALTGLLPLPFATVAPAVVWLPDDAALRPAVAGFVRSVARPDGARVVADEVILQLENPLLEVAREQAVHQLAALRTDQIRHLLDDPAAAGNRAVEIERAEATLARAEERLRQLVVRAEVGGTLALPRSADLLGRFVAQGATVGYVLAPEQMRVRAAVAEADADLVRRHTRGVQVRLADAPGAVRDAVVVGATPAATRALPSAALGDRAGGPFVIDRGAGDERTALTPVALFDLTLAGAAPAQVGGRGWVRFQHEPEPLAARLWRAGTQLFLTHFNPAS